MFNSILGVLSLADLGIATAITYSLYKPLSEQNEKKIGQIIHLFGKSYKIIGIIILVIGILLMPFLDFFVNFPNEVDINYHIIYLLFLLNSVFTYLFFSYKNTIIYADQKAYLTTKYEMFFTLITLFLQIFVLVFLKNYYLYLLVPIIINIVKNYRISLIATSLYPILKQKKHEKLTIREQKNIFKNIYSIAFIKLSGVVYSSTDSLIISAYINTIIAGYYSNYIMIINVIKGFINIAFSSMTASVGNLNASESSDYKYKVFERLNFINIIIYGYCATCLYQLLNPFITIWIGKQYIFSKTTVCLIVLTFLIPGMNNVVNIYKDACGLFWETRFRTLATAIINIVVSLLLVQCLGINGILLGTIIAYLSTIYIVDPIIIYKKVFLKKVSTYYLKLMRDFLIIFLINIIISIFMNFVVNNNIITLILKLLLITCLYLLITTIFYLNNPNFQYYLKLLKNFIRIRK